MTIEQNSHNNDSQGRVFVGGINRATTRESLMRCFDRYGAVRDLIYPYDKQGQPKGFAIIAYEDVDG
jgi:RNA recognition motif-containing protein